MKINAPSDEQSFIYALSLDGVVRYVGQTSRGAKRYCSPPPASRKRPCDDWLRKHWNDVQLDVLEVCEPNELNERETWWIAELETLMPNGLNLVAEGGTTRGYIYSDEQRSAIAAGVKSKWLDPEYRARMTTPQAIAARREGMLTDAERSRRTAENLSRYATAEGRKRHSDAMLAWRDQNPGKLQQAGKVSGHKRWHVARGIVKEGCELCGHQADS